MKTAFVCLGRNGDILNVLPMILHDYQKGNQPTVVASQPWEGLLDGVSYADKLVWHGNYAKPMPARDWAKSLNRFDEVFVPQCYGQKFIRHCESFCEEMYWLANRLSLWGQVPLVFDRRNRDREQMLIPNSTKPIVLVHTKGESSPFHQSAELWEALEPLRATHDLIDLSQINAPRFYDLLGLYEQAEYLVAIDSGPLHLAQAVPKLKVIALVTHSPTPWHGSPARPNHVARIRYNEFTQRKGEIADAILTNKQAQPRFVHVWSDYERHDPGTQRRHRMARVTWEREMKDWIDLPLADSSFDRTARTDFNDPKSAPYVTDMLDKAMALIQPWDIAVLTNDDTCVAPDLKQTLLGVLAECGACWGARREHKRVDRVMTHGELRQGRKHVGADIFAFTKGWWTQYGHEMPDMLLAFENWDYVLRTVIEENGGQEVEGLCYHEIHQGDWTKRRNTPAAKHNQLMGGEFFNARQAA